MAAIQSLPPFVKSGIEDNKDKDPSEMTDDIALANGTFLLGKLESYLNNIPFPVFQIPGFIPTDIVTQEKKDAILGYFTTDDRKRWLGRQLYLWNVFPNRIESDQFPGLMDDIPMFFNWLTDRPSQKAYMNGDTPLRFLLPAQGGRRRRILRKTRKIRKTRRVYKKSAIV